MVLALLTMVTSVGAQTVPTGYQDYFVLGFEQHVWDMMDRVRSYENPGASFDDGMNSVVTAVASADNQVIYYDHWEDGLEADILNPDPLVGTTLVLGNNDASDGRACDYTTDPRVVCGTADQDTLFEGTFLTLNSDEGLGCTTIQCSVPLNPRDPDDIRFDGGDRVVTSGGPLSVIHNQNPGTQVIGGATENISEQTVRAARSYSIPIGEDIYDQYGGYLGDTQPFKYVDVGLVAFEDDTAVFIDSPGETPVSLVLDRGESYSSRGLIDDNAAPAITINAGTKISTDKGVAGFIHTGADGNYATRFYTLLPDILHATDYVITAPGDGDGDRPANIYIFNPDPINDIEVTATDSVGSVVIDVPANSSVPYSDSAGAGRDVPPGSTVRMVSDRRFWGVSAYDYSTWASDWGHSWLARRFLTGIYTVGWAPGSTNTNPSTGLNASPVYVSATQDNTHVLIDLDNDDIYDQVDLDGDGNADLPDLPGNIYIVDALEALTIFDHTDFDNTGTRIVANKPVAVAWGQDTDLDSGGVIAHDTGYTVYPINQLFLDPVLTIDKLADTETVPLAGGVVSYTLTVQAHGVSPLDNLDVSDLLPAGVPQSAYVTGSSLITYPNLAQDTADPAVTTDLESGRTVLDWTLSQTTIQPGQYITVQYEINHSLATLPGLLLNTGRAHGSIGSSVFSPVAYESVVQTDAVLAKTVSHDGTPEVGESVSYTLTVENTGLADEADVLITDPIPPDTTFAVGSITSPVGPFTGNYDPGQNAVVWTATTFAAGAGPYALEFDVVINPGVEAETALLNEASYESAETPYFVARANLVTTGPRLEYEKQGPSIVQPGGFATFEISVLNTGVAAADDLTIIDSIPLNTSYIPGSMEWSLNSGPFTTLTDADDGDQGTVISGQVEFEESLLGPGEDIVFRFSVLVDSGAGGEFINNQATIYSTELPPGDTNLVQIPVGDAEITGVVFLDLDGDGSRDPSEPGVPFIDVVVTDSQGNTLVVSTDAAGEYSAFILAGNATVNVDESDPNFPPGATLSTANDPQVVNVLPGSSTPAQAVGYEPPELTFSKVSDALNSEVSPGQTVTYTMTLTNNTDTTQTGISIQDALPTGTSYVSGSSQVTTPGSRSIRVTEYYLPSDGGFSGDTYDLTLDQSLADDYFVMIRGSDGNGGTRRRGPDENYVSLVADPDGTGDLGASGASDRLSFTRQNSRNNWTGVITVVECLADCTTDGFELVDVVRINHTGDSADAATLPSGSWSDIDQVLLMGGYGGAGCDSTETDPRRHLTCHVRLVPSGSNSIDWSRSAAGDSWNATSTVMAVEWGSAWTVQDVHVEGDNGGDGAESTGDYNTMTLPVSVNRDDTWVWGTGFTSDDGVGDTAEGCLVTLGNGVVQNASENQVAVGIEHSGNDVDFQVWAMTHADMVVDHVFKSDGDDGDLTYDQTVVVAGAERMALAFNGMEGTNSRDWPASIFSARYVTDTTIRMQRRFANYEFPAWIQGADFSAFTNAGSSAPGGSPPNLVIPADGYTLAPNESMVVTFDVVVDLDLDPSLIQISNTATADTDQEDPVSANATDDVLRAGVSVEPNNSSYGVPGSTVIYSHQVINTGTSVDSFDITAETGLNWPVELLHPDTGAILAQDLDGDGVWDNGVTINTGTVPAGELVRYDLRVNIPNDAGDPGQPIQQTAGLRATSVRSPAVTATASDETLVVDSIGEVIITPDNSGVTTPSGTVAYSHRVVNLTGAPETFDLNIYNSQASGWTSTIHWDTNGDGEYTPGVDLAIGNTRRLEDGESQLIFVVVTADNQLDGAVNVSSITAQSQTNPNVLDGATDTTTVLDEPIDFDLSGGGTLQVVPGGVAVFPGHLKNLGDSQDTYDLTITASPFFGPGGDGLLHPTQLFVDTDADGVPDLMIAEDLDGNGVWDTVDPAYDTNNSGIGDGNPDLTVAGEGGIAYELRRPVDPSQGPYRDPVTLTAQSWASGDRDSVTATNILTTESYALLSAFDCYSADGRVVVEWRTASENGTIGFDLYRRESAKDDFRRINKRILTGLLDSPQGGTYRVLDPDGVSGARVEYLLVERDVWGNQNRLGPFDVQANELTRSDPRRNGRVWDGAFQAEGSHVSFRTPGAGAIEPAGDPSGRLKVAIREEGLVWVPTADLASRLGGLPESRIAKVVHQGGLRLTNQGEEVAWIPEDGGAGFYFFGETLDSIYTLDNIYWLELDFGLTMEPLEGKPPDPTSVGSFVEALHFEDEFWPVTALVDDPESDFWMWEPIVPGDPTHGSKSFTLRTPAVADGEYKARVTIRLQGALKSLASPNHHVKVSLNGVLIGEAMWDDLNAHTTKITFSQELLNSGDNTLEVEGVLVSGTTADLMFVDSIDVHYQRELRADADRLIFTARRDQIVTVDGFSTPEVQVFNLNNRKRPIILTGSTVTQTAAGFSASFYTGKLGGEFLAVAPAAAQTPHAITEDLKSDLRSPKNMTEHVIIAGPGLAGTAQVLADHRSASGLKSVVVRVEDVYDEFNHGIVNPWAIRDFLQFARTNWELAPGYVLLAGDSSHDYIDRYGFGANLVPAPQLSSPNGLVVSDNQLGDFAGNDGVPDVAIGRLPAQSPAELETMIAKTIAFETSEAWWKSSTLWVADDPDQGGEFSVDLTALLDRLSAQYQAYRIDLENTGIYMGRDLLKGRLETGSGLLGFLGHAGLDNLAADPSAGIGVLMNSDIGQLLNEDRTPVFVAMTCSAGRFDMFSTDILAEGLLLHAEGGAVAVWAPSGWSMNDDAVRVGGFFIDRISRTTHRRLGDAVREALQRFSRPASSDPVVPAHFVLLGDPALELGP